MELIQEFRQAVNAGNAEALRSLFAAQPELKARIDDPIFAFDTPAIVNVARSSRGVVDVLLKNGADIDARSSWWAGSFGVLDHDNHELAAYLIERGARVDAHAAARHGLLELLRELLEAEPAVANARGGDGQTPLHVAGSVEAARILLDHGAEIDTLDIDHESSPAQYLVRSHPDVVRYLISRGCRTDILLACAVGDVELVRRHLDANPEAIRTRVDENWFPMWNPRAGGHIYHWTLGGNRSPHRVAHAFGHSAVLELLNERTPDDLRLIQACLTADRERVRALAEKSPDLLHGIAKANPEYVSEAAEDNNAEVVGVLLESGWPVEGGGRATPLHWACWHGNAELVRTILRFASPLEKRDADFNATPLGWAIHGSEHGAFRDTGDYAEVASLLLLAGAIKPERIEGSEPVRQVLQRFGGNC